MTRAQSTLSPDYFEARYRANPDPWDFSTSDYEQQKYLATLGALTKPRYANALEVGCSIGVFTRMLSDRCDAVTALDVSDTALEACRMRCGDRPNVAVVRGMIPLDWPDGHFDLIVFSEVLYYLDRNDLVATARKVRDSLRACGEILLVHWLGETDYPLTGNEAADLFIQQLADVARVHAQDWTSAYRLDLLQAGIQAPLVAEDGV